MLEGSEPAPNGGFLGTNESARPPRKRSRFASFMRAVFAIVLVAVVAGLIAAVILLATDAGQNTDVGKFISDNVDQQIQDVKDYLDTVTNN